MEKIARFFDRNLGFAFIITTGLTFLILLLRSVFG